MYGLLIRTWWVVLVRGATAAAFGAALLGWPKLPVAVLGLAFGGFAVVDGTLGIVAALAGGRRDAWALLIEGTGGAVSGIIVLGWPAVTTATLLVLIAVWCGVRGFAQLWTAWCLHRHCPNEPTLVAAAVTVLVACFVLIARPFQDRMAVERVAGAAAVTAGALLMLLAARLWVWLRNSHQIAASVGGQIVRSGQERAV
jgi:uncharacterized membrane protein HdeD (DUF308 family)